MTEQEQAIASIASALKQVLACNPQLLFKATQQCYSDYLLDCMKAGLETKPKTVEALGFRASICQIIASLLLRSGRAHLDDDDVNSMALYLNLMRNFDTKEPT